MIRLDELKPRLFTQTFGNSKALRIQQFWFRLFFNEIYLSSLVSKMSFSWVLPFCFFYLHIFFNTTPNLDANISVVHRMSNMLTTTFFLCYVKNVNLLIFLYCIFFVQSAKFIYLKIGNVKWYLWIYMTRERN